MTTGGVRGFIAGVGLMACAAAMAFESEDVRIRNARDGVMLAGTLLTPDGGNPKAAILLASGSGGQDRDETVLGHKPFKAIAEALAGEGYAVLRVDDRGVGESTGNPSDITLESNLRDAAAAVEWLDSAYHAAPTGIIGHSEGGLTAVRMAANGQADFIVTLAAPAWAGDSIVMSQGKAMAESMAGHWDGEALQRKILDVAKSNLPTPLARTSIYMDMASTLGDMAKLPQVQEQLMKQVEAVVSPWYRGFLRYDPAADIRRVGVPWLALNGSKDMQVLPGNLADIKKLNPEATTRLLDGLNHLFLPSATGSPAEYASLPGDFSAEAVTVIANWLDGLELQHGGNMAVEGIPDE